MSPLTNPSTRNNKIIFFHHPTGGLDDFILVVGDNFDSFPISTDQDADQN